MKVKALTPINHDGKDYAVGKTLDVKEDVVKALVEAGAVRDPDAPEEVVDGEDTTLEDAQKEAARVVDEAKKQAEQIVTDAKAEAAKVSEKADQDAKAQVAAAEKQATEIVEKAQADAKTTK